MVVRMRHTRGQTGRRRSHHALKNPGVTVDSKTGVAHMRHRASVVTGMYRGRQVIDVAARLEKKTKKISEATDATIKILEEEEIRILNEMKATFA